MDLASPQDADDLVAEFLQPQGHLDFLLVGGGHFDDVLVAEEIGGVEAEDMQGVGFDPLAAIEEPAQGADLRMDGQAPGPLYGVGGGHLVSDGADAADAGGDIDGFGGHTPAQEGLEKARRLIDLKLDVLQFAGLDLDVQRALAFDAGETVDLNRGDALAGRDGGGAAHLFSTSSLAWRNCQAQAL